VKSGGAFINSAGNAGSKITTIKQNTPLLGLQWDSFNLGVNETVNFIQLSTSSVVFNRILDSQGSQILGKINANGHVWLVNPNGLFFGQTAQVNVGGLVASTLNSATPQGFGSYSHNLAGNSTASVENQGVINAGFPNSSGTGPNQGGFVALVGHSVKNTGNITTSTDGGSVVLAAGSDINLQFAGNSLISVTVNQNQLNAMAVNGGLMQCTPAPSVCMPRKNT
jgi:filamentous hemagglutinin family protein